MVKVITNNVPRDIIDGFQLSAKERTEFDYLDWDKIDEGTDSASFFRYRGELYDMGTFMRSTMPIGENLPPHLSQWDGHCGDSYFSATVVRFVENNERIIVGRVYS